MTWQQAASIDQLERGPVVFKKSPKQIALFRVGEDVFAVDNRCPHEGYPLAEGHVDGDCVLTCNWHNWKFRLTDGKCTLGGDHVRSYPVKLEDGQVWVNVEDPSPHVVEQDILEGLKKAFLERDFGRICREIARLHYNKLDPLVAVRKAIEWSHDKFEFGTTHAFGAAADWLADFRSYDGDWEKQLICLAETVDHMAFDSLRQPSFPFAESGDAFDSTAFVEAVESEDRQRAEALVRRGLDDGLHWSDFELAFVEAALAHFNDFGHTLIYVYKTEQLLQQAGEQLEPYLLPVLARHLCYTTREDLLPQFKTYAAVLRELESPGLEDQSQLYADDLFPATTPQASAWVAKNIAGHRPQTLYDALLAALARNLLCYDMSFQDAFDRSVPDSIGWLSFTHGITFANAVRILCTRYPQFWPQGLLQMACMLGRNRRFLDTAADRTDWNVTDRDAFFTSIRERNLDHGLRDPIFSAHLIKTTKAVQEELESASPSCQTYLLAGLNRFLHSPLKQKHVRRLARQANDLVSRDFVE